MNTKFTREQLLIFSNDEMLEKTNGKAVDFHLADGRLTQLCVNDLEGYNDLTSCFYTKTGIKIALQEIEFIEVIDAVEKEFLNAATRNGNDI